MYQGFIQVSPDIIAAAAEQVIELLTNTQLRHDVVEHNFQVAAQHYSLAALRRHLNVLMESSGDADDTPPLSIVIPTYWGRPLGESPKPGDAIFDHPTPLDGDSTLPRLLKSLASGCWRSISPAHPGGPCGSDLGGNGGAARAGRCCDHSPNVLK